MRPSTMRLLISQSISEGRFILKRYILHGKFWNICALRNGIFWSSAEILGTSHRIFLKVTGRRVNLHLGRNPNGLGFGIRDLIGAGSPAGYGHQ